MAMMVAAVTAMLAVGTVMLVMVRNFVMSPSAKIKPEGSTPANRI
jgi:hypothetical protein